MHIAIEGMDGVGKTTVAHLLAARLGFRVVEKPLHHLLDEPGQTVNYLKYRDFINQQVDNDSLRAWFYGLGNLFLYHHFESQNIVTDRHLVSNYYWCGGPDTEEIFRCLVALIGRPDYTFLLHATIEEAARRIRIRNPNDSDLQKASLGREARPKMESFLVRYDMPHTVIDTTNLNPEDVLEIMLDVMNEHNVCCTITPHQDVTHQ